MRSQMTLGEKYGPAMEITEQAEADAYFEECVKHSMINFSMTRTEAEECERANLGYYAGYYSSETREHVERLFACSHPVFGKIAELGEPTAKEALEAGLRRGRGDQHADLHAA